MFNNKYNFDNLEIISITEGDVIPIEIIEPDPINRKIKYPYIKSQQKITTKYKNGNKIITKIILKNIKLEKRRILERKKWKKFGKAKLSNKGITSISDIIEIKYAIDQDQDQDKDQDKLQENIKQNKTTISKKSFYDVSKIDTSKFKPYEENITKTKGYIPNSIKLKLKENENIEKITLIIKNISVNETFENLKNILHGMFKKYGEINYIKLLKDHKTGNPKDIAFLEYYYSLDAIKLLESKERFIINNCILSISKSK